MKKVIIATLLGFLFLVLLCSYLLFSYFRIKKVFIIAPDNQIYGLEILKDKNYLFIDKQNIVSYILAKNNGYKKINILKMFPDSLQLIFEWRSPFAQIISGEKNFYIDKDGFPAKSYQNSVTNLPEIKIPSIIYNPNSADWRLTKALTIMKDLNKYGYQFSDISINTDSTELNGKIDSLTDITISLDKDASVVGASLQTIISRFRIEGKNISSIDYRFDKPVVVLKNE